MATGPFLLRIEGVNLGSFVYDTQNLPTIRGGSLLLLDQVEGIGRIYPKELTPISTGASVGLFRVQDGVDAQQIAVKLRNDLLTHHQLQHATFVVDVAQMQDKTPQSFINAREQLIALNRFQQQHAPMVSIPKWNEDKDAVVCPTDQVRAAIVGKNSKAVNVRQQHGLAAKQKFYKRQFPLDDPNPAADMEFTNDLEELTDGYENVTLNRKMAVIYIDGNGFSSIQNRLVLAAANAEIEQKRIDEELKGYRREFLRSLLAEMKKQAGLWRNADRNYRLEVLLWGGDDIVLVVPAWLGWRTAAIFYDCASTWQLGEPPKHTLLKHAMGIVFCHHNAPIHRIKHLAEELSNLAKLDRGRNLIAYAVLETFDHAGSDLDAYRSRRFPDLDASKQLLDGESIHSAIKTFSAVEQDIPRSKVYLLLRLLLEQLHHRNPDDKKREDISEKIKKIEAEIRASCRNTAKLQELEACLGGTPGAWAHILELWDYLCN